MQAYCKLLLSYSLKRCAHYDIDRFYLRTNVIVTALHLTDSKTVTCVQTIEIKWQKNRFRIEKKRNNDVYINIQNIY